MKKIVSLLLILCMAFTVVACNNSEDNDGVRKETPDPRDCETAEWDGYEGASFRNFMNMVIEKYNEIEPGSAVTIKYINIEEGWGKSGNLDADTDLSDGCKALTYIVDASDEEVAANIYIFMEYNESENLLSVKGGIVSGDGLEDEYNKEETEYSLNVGKAILEDENALDVE